jgi:NAD(P)-dependent dehydrogenase (short-subunit alcohol dehydrogenase family)
MHQPALFQVVQGLGKHLLRYANDHALHLAVSPRAACERKEHQYRPFVSNQFDCLPRGTILIQKIVPVFASCRLVSHGHSFFSHCESYTHQKVCIALQSAYFPIVPIPFILGFVLFGNVRVKQSDMKRSEVHMNAQSNMTRRICVVTGATGMLGQATAIELARSGASVILVCRNDAQGRQVLEEVKQAGPDREHQLVIGDLSEPAAVRAMTVRIREKVSEIHALIHTAAAFTAARQENSQGQEVMFATNQLGRFLLTYELLPLLRKGSPARVLIATGPSPDALNFDDLMAHKQFGSFAQFRTTNVANLMFTFELARRLKGAGVTANAYHPGALQSNLMRKMPLIVRLLTLPVGRDATKAARALAALALDDQYEQATGQFFNFEKPINAPKNSQDVQAQRRLWEETERLLGLEWNV